MAEKSEMFVPAAAALPIIEARLAVGWRLLAVAGFRVKRGDTTPDPALACSPRCVLCPVREFRGCLH